MCVQKTTTQFLSWKVVNDRYVFLSILVDSTALIKNKKDEMLQTYFLVIVVIHHPFLAYA